MVQNKKCCCCYCCCLSCQKSSYIKKGVWLIRTSPWQTHHDQFEKGTKFSSKFLQKNTNIIDKASGES